MTANRSTITHELGVVLESRYGETYEHEGMAKVLRSVPDIADDIMEIWCDSKACADYSVMLAQPVSRARAREVGRQLGKAFERVLGGYNGLWVKVGDIVVWEDSGNWKEENL